MRGPRPSSGGWSEPRRRPGDWTRKPAPDAQDPDAQQPPGHPWNGQQPTGQARNGQHTANGHPPQGQEPFLSEPWDTRQAPGPSLGTDPSQSPPWGVQPASGPPRGDEPASQPWSTGQVPGPPRADEPAGTLPWSADPTPGQARGGDPPGTRSWGTDTSNGLPRAYEPSSGQLWETDPSSARARGDDPSGAAPWSTDHPTGLPRGGQPTTRHWDAGQALGQHGGEPTAQPWSTGQVPSQSRGGEPPGTPEWSADQSPSQGWGAQPGQGRSAEAFQGEPGAEHLLTQLWGVQTTRSKALELAPSRSRRRGDAPAYARLASHAAGLRGNGRMALVIAVPLVISLLLLVTAGPGRILPRNSAQEAAKRPAAAPVQAGDQDRLVALINQERARNGLPGMRVLRRLNAVAAAHAAEMARLKRIQPDPNVAVSARPATSVSQYVDCASNIDQVYRRMFASATYRAQILSPTQNGMGLGTVSGNCLWVTVLFARATPPASASKPAAPVGGGPRPAPKAPDKPAPVQTAPARPSTTAEAIARDLFNRANAERKARGLAQLAWSDDLAKLASDWSGQMARTGRFVHRDLDEAHSQPGIGQYSALGENIAWVRGYEDDGYELHLGWMRSDGHRRNLLQPGFDTVGIGVVCSGGKAWATQNFGRLSASAPPLTDSTPATEPIVATAKDGLSC